MKAASSPSKTTDGEPIPDVLAACRDAIKMGDKVIKAAEPGVSHWADHLRAHTDLVEGKLDYSEVKSIFERTSAAGPSDLNKFDAADKEYRKVATACDAVDNKNVPDAWEFAAEACVFFDGATRSVIEEARTAIEDWRNHLADERAHREGELTGDEAEAKWIKAWRNGSPKIAAFESALKQREKTPPCDTSSPLP